MALIAWEPGIKIAECGDRTKWEFQEASWMETPRPNGSVFDDGSLRVTELLLLKVACRRRRAELGESHVNSPDRRKPANATHSAALMLIPLKSFLASTMISSRIGAVRGSRSLLSPSPCTRLAPRIHHLMRGRQRQWCGSLSRCGLTVGL